MIGDNGKILVFPLDELPEMPRGKGVKLQSYREGGLRDGLVFSAEAGLAWTDTAGRSAPGPNGATGWASGRPPARSRRAGFPTSRRFKPR